MSNNNQDIRRGSTVRLKPIALSMLALTLAACGGGGSNQSIITSPSDSSDTSTAVTTGPKTITVVPMLGGVMNADIRISSLDGKFSATGNTSSTGLVKFTVPADVNAIKIVMSGVDSTSSPTKYYEEADNDTWTIPAGVSLQAATLVSSDGESFAVTPLTNAAVAYAEHSLGGLNTTSIINANDFIAKNFDLTDTYGNELLTVPYSVSSPMDFQSMSIATLRQKAATRYAIWLAGASAMARQRLPAGTAAPSLVFASQLASDIQDGLLDGKLDGTAVPITSYQSLKQSGTANMANGLKQGLMGYVNTLKALPDGGATVWDGIDKDVASLMDNYVFTVLGGAQTSDPTTEPVSGSGYQPPTTPGGTDTSGQTTLASSNISASALAPYDGTYNGISKDGKTACTIRLDSSTGIISVSQAGVVVSSHTLNSEDNDSLYSQYDASNVLTGLMFVARNTSDTTSGSYALFFRKTINGVSKMVLSSAGDYTITDLGNQLGVSCAADQPTQ